MMLKVNVSILVHFWTLIGFIDALESEINVRFKSGLKLILRFKVGFRLEN